MHKMAGPGGSRLYMRALFLWLSSSLAVEEFLGQCGQTIDLMSARSFHSGVLRMPLPQSMSRYQNPAHPINCDILITFASGTNLLIELFFLDIMPRSNDIRGCTTGLEVLDQTGRKYYGSRICMEGWQWEERHREKRYEKHFVESSPLTFRLVSEGPYRGQGFKVHFNQIRPNGPCFIQEFKCLQNLFCVHDDVTCDGWDDCGNYSDEREEAGCNLLTASEICSVIMGIVLLLGMAAQLVLFVITSRRLAQQYGWKNDSKPGVVDGKSPVEAGDIGMRQQYNSEESLPSRYSRSSAPSRKRQESQCESVNKLELEKGNRTNKPSVDHKAEQTNCSSSRRDRTQSEATISSEPASRAGRKTRTSSQSSLNRDRVDPVSGFDNPALENTDSPEKGPAGSRERLSSRDRESWDHNGRSYKYSDHSNDSDSDYNERRRRRSHSRSKEQDYKKGNQYSNETNADRDYRRRKSYGSDDSDYEYDRERRQRSRERFSRDKYDDYSDSDRERYRRGPGRYTDKAQEDRDSRDGDRNPSEDDNDRSVRQNKTEKRKGSQQSRSRDDLHSLEAYRESLTLPLPPPYSEEDTASLDQYHHTWPPPEENLKHGDQKNTNLPQSNKNFVHTEAGVKQPVSAVDDSKYRRSSGDRRDRYSQNRWKQSSPPPRYGDISPKSAAVSYKEDSV